MTDSDDALLPLDAVRPAASPKGAKGAVVPAAELPVARVAVDNPLPHLDRPFDYLVPAAMHDTARPGVRVRVRFAGKLVDGFLLERAGQSDHAGKLTPLERVVSPEQVLTPEVAGLARAVADRYAGTLGDVLRLAIPPRHARTEAATRPVPETSGEQAASEREPEPQDAPDAGTWADYPMGPSFIDALRNGRAPRAVWTALPGGGGWATGFAEAVRATLEGGRGALAVVPDGKDVALLDEELSRALGPGRHVALTSDLGPAERYRRWLSVLRGQARAVVGTRAAMFAPVERLGLVAVWDDGDDLHAERLAPYPHAREVLGLRAHRTGAAMLIGGYARTAEATQLIAARWARPIVAARQEIRRRAPRVRAAGEDAELARDQAARAARLPSVAWRALRQGLDHGPVLVQVPRRGYLPALACAHCRAPARCAHPPTRMSALEWAGPPSGEGQLPYEETGEGTAGSRQDTYGEAGRGSRDAAPGGSRRGVPDGGEAGGGSRDAVPGGSRHGGEAPAPDGARRGGPDGGEAGPGEGSRGAEEFCHGPLALRTGHAAPYCRWCGRVDAAWKCPACGSHRLRAVVVGARRTAEELGRAFPSVPVRTSGRDGVLARLPAGPALVVATPGAEPVAEGGYAAAVLLDGWALLGRADLRAGEEAVRRWMNAAALLRPAAELVVLADAALPAVQALVRWDPVTHAERELADRAELGFPPAVRMATLTGAASAVRQMLEESRLPGGAQVLGPVPVDDAGRERAMVRVPRGGGAALAAALKGASGVRAARKAAEVVKVCVDPLDLI
ncbi:primosomal protein N' [Nonomuraea ferruginea]|uniref:Probable replication restart protein PriA n=1 Tax=Nonomuraea ferruginea TaxID=46174 RepID=A0ABT4SRP6_9ACTN|nr:primosomal protein N' [Nonomuraea ferruginea]MDA0639924.1 primosomal protein N' [Nonomuraea ferruginea]